MELLAAALRAALVLVVLFMVGSGAASARSVFAPTPAGPVYGGIPGALPAHFAYAYDSGYRGWPVAPTNVQHPVRGAFLDPRGVDDTGLSGYHFGIDVSIDDRHPETGAPGGFSHRVYAIESGRVSEPPGVLARPCSTRRLQVGHFAYWHVSPIVATRAYAKAGQQIGWSCLGVWHVHVSEWQRFRGRQVWVNPLHRGGRIAPYVDTAAPVVNALVFVSPPARPWLPTTTLAQPDTSTRLPPSRLHGNVELRANVGDPQSFLGFLADHRAWTTVFTPYELGVTIRSVSSGKVIIRRTSFRADQLPQTPYVVHYGPGTVEDDNMQECVGPPQKPTCAGTYWFRPFSRFTQGYWNTHTTANGRYEVTVRATDLAGNTTARTVTVSVRN